MSNDQQVIAAILTLVAVVLSFCFRAIWVLSKENCEYEQRQKADSQTIDWQGREISRLKITNSSLLDERRQKRVEEARNKGSATPSFDEWEDLSRRYIEYWKTFLPAPPGK